MWFNEDYILCEECENEEVIELCEKCGKCGRIFDDMGIMLDDGGTTDVEL
jgi:hypothetical protein